jgi:hypothetical protein
MKLVGIVSTALLSLTLVVAAPVFAQEQHEDDAKAKPAQQEENKTQPVKPGTQKDKAAKPVEKNAKQQDDKNAKPAEKNVHQQRAGNNGSGRIPADKFKANFGQQHTFRVSQAEYGHRSFQYGGYSFGFVDPWPSNWLYTQDVYVVDINGVYYLCNASFPGVNLALSFTL